VPRHTRNDTERHHASREADRLTQQAKAIEKRLGVGEYENQKEADEIETGRGWADGGVIYRSVPLYETRGPMDGLREEIARLDEMLDRKIAELPHSGTRVARQGAERNIANLEEEIASKRQRLWEWQDLASEYGALQPCRSVGCGNEIDARADTTFAQMGYCAPCFATAIGAKRP
jgi:hypothetical protein